MVKKVTPMVLISSEGGVFLVCTRIRVFPGQVWPANEPTIVKQEILELSSRMNSKIKELISSPNSAS